ncbi:YlmC/YmxH family sporulation protein [Zhaonella formicivorans]|uniref:YlmC/YmxH family sporulation protein n=1 Tax=Zhaonella formicivorans TaxID=2528593 RepID=UPI0010ED59DF|nr:YlmC/YmxH family sporulation protein [Zhaonella formicivorans]
MLKVSDLRMRDVINVLDGRRLGVIKDIDVDIERGKVTALILPGSGKFMGLFGKNDDIVIPWEKIKKLGVDVILVELQNFTDPRHD